MHNSQNLQKALELRQLIVDGVMEIVNNYDIDGIHFDDYFYPDQDRLKFNDSATYNKYKQEGQSLADWRRSNNDALIFCSLLYNFLEAQYTVGRTYRCSAEFHHFHSLGCF